MTEEFRQMELEHCQRLLALVDAALEQVPQAELLRSFERIRRDDIDKMVDLGAIAWREHGKLRHRQQILEERTADLERAEANNRRLLAQHFLKTSTGRKDVRPIEGESTCQAIQGEGYCGAPAVAECFSGGVWRPVCATCVEGL